MSSVPDTNRIAMRLEQIDHRQIIPKFQAIVDLEEGRVFAYEVLSRGPWPFESPDALFAAAEREGLSWEVERACRLAALHKIAELQRSMGAARYFVNVSPRWMNDPRFTAGFTLDALGKLGLRQSDIVLEITEQESIRDYPAYEAAIRHYAAQGFAIALDDFGSGHSGIVTLIATRPNFMKLDMQLTRGIHRDAYKRTVLRSLLRLSKELGAALIAEGVESVEEFDTLRELEVRFVQGWLFSRAEEDPREARRCVEATALLAPASRLDSRQLAFY
ncbi:MAG: EAL domain-containing protein [Thermoanaerobaculia bacterium]